MEINNFIKQCYEKSLLVSPYLLAVGIILTRAITTVWQHRLAHKLSKTGSLKSWALVCIAKYKMQL
jgi:hypothetical protein